MNLYFLEFWHTRHLEQTIGARYPTQIKILLLLLLLLYNNQPKDKSGYNVSISLNYTAHLMSATMFLDVEMTHFLILLEFSTPWLVTADFFQYFQFAKGRGANAKLKYVNYRVFILDSGLST